MKETKGVFMMGDEEGMVQGWAEEGVKMGQVVRRG